MKENETPILYQLIKSGAIYLGDDVYYGKASDGLEVVLGSLGREWQIEVYLEKYPTPDKW